MRSDFILATIFIRKRSRYSLSIIYKNGRSAMWTLIRKCLVLFFSIFWQFFKIVLANFFSKFANIRSLIKIGVTYTCNRFINILWTDHSNCAYILNCRYKIVDDIFLRQHELICATTDLHQCYFCATSF